MVFRFSTPLAISVADFVFLGRQLPSPRAWASLIGLLVGAVGYALTDAAFEVRGYVRSEHKLSGLRAWYMFIGSYTLVSLSVFVRVPLNSLTVSSRSNGKRSRAW